LINIFNIFTLFKIENSIINNNSIFLIEN
jgi:hypothetical protein